MAICSSTSIKKKAPKIGEFSEQEIEVARQLLLLGRLDEPKSGDEALANMEIEGGCSRPRVFKRRFRLIDDVYKSTRPLAFC